MLNVENRTLETSRLVVACDWGQWEKKLWDVVFLLY